MSSFGAMFFNDPVAAFTNIGGGLRPSGTLALLAWRTLPENEWLMSVRGALAVGRELPMPPPDAPTPFALADPERVRSILESAGFDGVELEPIDELIDLGTDASDALEFAKTMGIVEGLTDGLDAEARARGDVQPRRPVPRARDGRRRAPRLRRVAHHRSQELSDAQRRPNEVGAASVATRWLVRAPP